MHEHDHRGVTQHLAADLVFLALLVGQSDAHVVHVEDAPGINGFATDHFGGHVHVDAVRGGVQLMVEPMLQLFLLASPNMSSPRKKRFRRVTIAP